VWVVRRARRPAGHRVVVHDRLCQSRATGVTTAGPRCPVADKRSAFLRLSLESLSGALVQSGELTLPDIEHALATIDDPNRVFLSAPMIAAWGCRPARRR
jgi:hypothetical protein